MSGLTFNEETIAYMDIFQKMTGAEVIDCIDFAGKLVFVVKRGDIGKAIGKKGERISRLRQRIKRDLLVIEHSEDPKEFVANVFHQYDVQRVEITKKRGVTHTTVRVKPSLKGKAIGKDGSNLRLAREIIKRHHPIESVSVA